MRKPKFSGFFPHAGLEPVIRESLFDPVTSLPMLPLLLDPIRKMLGHGQQMGLLTLSVTHYTKFEELYGWETLDTIVRGVADCLREVKKECLRREDLAELTVSGNALVLLLSPPRHRRSLLYRDLSRVRERIQKKLGQFLQRRMKPELIHHFGYFIGCGVMKEDPSVRLERMVYRTIEEALSDAASEKQKHLHQKSLRLMEIIDSDQISSVYQPIVDLQGRCIMGYEVLIRGPKGEFESPDVLFKIAYETELIWNLERVSRKHALTSLKKLRGDQLLFLNVEPASIFDPELMRHKAFKNHIHRVVFEITERAAIDDLQVFREAVQHLKNSGFKVSVDDVGSQYSGLRLIAAIDPDFIKLDMELTRGVQHSHVKTQLIRAINRFSKEVGLPLIVEGVETKDELRVLKELGVRYAQGFLFRRPGPELGRSRTYIPPR